MLGKIFAGIILVSVLYIFGVFFAPDITDTLAQKLGIHSVNTTIRQLKNGVDSTSETLLQIQDASGAINGVRGVVNQMNEKIDQTTETINTIRQVGEQKVEQAQKTADSLQKVGQSINEAKSNITELTSFSGTLSGIGIQTGGTRP